MPQFSIHPQSPGHESVRRSEIRPVVPDMTFAKWLIGISCAVGIFSADSKVFSQPANQIAQQPEALWSTIQLYCFGCHNEGVRAGNLLLDQLGAESVPKHPEIFEKVVRKLLG